VESSVYNGRGPVIRRTGIDPAAAASLH